LSELSKKQPELGKVIAACQASGDAIPDRIICSLIEQRLKKPDCQVNGWVLEGFPETEAQCNLLKAMKIKPSVVFIFEQLEVESIEKLFKRRVDPKTGALYNLDLVRLKDKHLTSLLLEAGSDPTLLAQLGLRNTSPEVLDTLQKDSEDATRVDSEILSRLEPREEDQPVFVAKKFAQWNAGAAILEDSFGSQVEIIDVGEVQISKLQQAMCYKIFPDNFEKVVIQPRSKKALQEKASKIKPAPPKPKPVVEKPIAPPAPKPAPKKEEPKKEEPKKEEAPEKKGIKMPEGNTEIPKEYAEIMTVWYGPDNVWNRHVAPPDKAITMKWFKKDDVFDKLLSDKFKTDIEELAKGNKEEMRKDHYGALAYFLLGD
jgi:uncharacterized protein (DUF924 family)/adenylate kinase family enzyme